MEKKVPVAEHPARETLRSRLRKSEHGAMVVFGIFFAIVALSMLYYMSGLGATMYYRERLQDAADGSAFASAIVHARGMNTLALINVVMASLLAVLVALRLVEALIIIAEVILYALAWLGGATAAIASALEVVREAVDEVVEAVQPIIFNANKVLKVGGEVIRVATPLAANVSVLGKVANHYDPEVLGAIAIPPRITLPVEDDDFPYLCKKAGVIAGTLALLPIKPIVPGGLRKKLAGALGKLVEQGSSWFCDGGDPPTFKTDPEVNNFPASKEMQECTDRNKQNEDSVALCQAAEKAEGAGEPDEKTGQCRAGQPLCQQIIDDDTGQPFPFSPTSYCGSEEGKAATVTADDCIEVPTADGRMVPDASTAYGKRLITARSDCDPTKYDDRHDYWWMQRELDVTWQWDADAKKWTELSSVETVPPTAMGRPAVDDVPCRGVPFDTVDVLGVQLKTKLDGTWNAGPDLATPVCTIDAPKPGAPTPPDPLLPAQPKSAVTDPAVTDPAAAPDVPAQVVLRRVEVLQVLGCSSTDKEGKDVQVGAINLAADKYSSDVSDLNTPPDGTGGDYANLNTDDLGVGDDASSSGSESQNTVPYRFIKGHRLGTSDMQIRSLVFGARLGDSSLSGEGADGTGISVHKETLNVVSMSKWRKSGDELTGLSSASEIWGRLAVAQAEYYFDVGASEDVLAKWGKWDEQDAEDSGRDFMWKMAWTARMRRFRLSWKVDGESADGPSAEAQSQSEGSQSDRLMSKLGIDADMQGQSTDDIASNGPKALCNVGKLKNICAEVSGMMTSFDNIFIH